MTVFRGNCIPVFLVQLCKCICIRVSWSVYFGLGGVKLSNYFLIISRCRWTLLINWSIALKTNLMKVRTPVTLMNSWQLMWMRTHLRSVQLPWLRVHEFLLVYVQFKYTEDRLVLREDCWTFKKKLIVTFATPMLQRHCCLKLISAVLNYAWLSIKEDLKLEVLTASWLSCSNAFIATSKHLWPLKNTSEAILNASINTKRDGMLTIWGNYTHQ